MQHSQCLICGSIEVSGSRCSRCRWCHTETHESGLIKTCRVFSLDKYREWSQKAYGGNDIPDWTRTCNGRPVYSENGQATWIAGIDGEYYPSNPEWEEIAQ